MIHIYFLSSLGKVYCVNFHHCRISVTDFTDGRGGGEAFCPLTIREQPRKSPSRIGLKVRKNKIIRNIKHL